MRRRQLILIATCVVFLAFFGYTFHSEYHDRVPSQAEWIGIGIGLLGGVLGALHLNTRWNPYNRAVAPRTTVSPAYRRRLFWIPFSGVLLATVLPRFLEPALRRAFMTALLMGILLFFLFALLKLVIEPVP